MPQNIKKYHNYEVQYEMLSAKASHTEYSGKLKRMLKARSRWCSEAVVLAIFGTAGEAALIRWVEELYVRGWPPEWGDVHAAAKSIARNQGG